MDKDEALEAARQVERGERPSGDIVLKLTGPNSLTSPGVEPAALVAVTVWQSVRYDFEHEGTAEEALELVRSGAWPDDNNSVVSDHVVVRDAEHRIVLDTEDTLDYRPTTDCGCGYPLVWVDGEWQHDVAPGLWGDDHQPKQPEPTGERREYWDEQDGVS